MTFRHVLVSLAVTCLCACSSDDTIVSLNVTATDRVPAVEHLQVTVKQGSHTHAYSFVPPDETSAEPDSVKSIKNSFFQRITLPGDWDESEATVSVEALQAGDAKFDPPLVDETEVTIRPNGVVAAFVKLDIPEAPPMEGGEGGAGGEAGAAAGGNGGAANNEGGTPGAAGTTGEGEGGAPSAGGAGAGGAG
jgi:hypothetical protein